MSFFKPDWREPNERNALRAVKKITDPIELLRVIVNDRREAVAMAAFQKLPPVAELYVLLVNEAYLYPIKEAAFARLVLGNAPENCFRDIAIKATTDDWGRKALEQIRGLTALETVFCQCERKEIRKEALEKFILSCSEVALGQFLNTAYKDKGASRALDDLLTNWAVLHQEPTPVAERVLELLRKDRTIILCNRSLCHGLFYPILKVLQERIPDLRPEDFQNLSRWTVRNNDLQKIMREILNSPAGKEAAGKLLAAMAEQKEFNHPLALEALEVANSREYNDIFLPHCENVVWWRVSKLFENADTQVLRELLFGGSQYAGELIDILAGREALTANELASFLDESCPLRHSASRHLAALGDMRALPAAIEREDTTALSRLPCKESVDALVDILRTNGDWSTANKAAWALKDLYKGEMHSYILEKPLKQLERGHYDLGDWRRSCHSDEDEIRFEFLH